jgi:hypothetical protein
MPHPTRRRPLLLKDLIGQLRREITEAVSDRIAHDERPLFRLDGVDLEVHFVIEQEESLEGSASAKLLAVVGFKAGAKQTYSEEQVQKVTLHLSALKTPTSLTPDRGPDAAERVNAYRALGIDLPVFPADPLSEYVLDPGDILLEDVPGLEQSPLKLSDLLTRVGRGTRTLPSSGSRCLSWKVITGGGHGSLE